ncbi:diguanylate cyclase (GGDEF) domain-containing protein [Devosia crocina]|uniref:Diguanylate cyclase (GGDEF) domain-containing protein n=1 Tax=Devosia crocina TaxID=429728 RepID=A0A1I7NPG1_9HYPH|nr:EAL domain-containing protein [Devosia crocina]SFV36564.1 diguanylate cyclase (GGDEF) domain-containing protein [Devosia crocina]
MTGGNTTQLMRLQTEILEAVAQGETLPAIARLLCTRAEQYAPGISCSVVLIDDADRLRPLAAPSMPASFSEAIDGLAIGPDIGSCGTAAFRNSEVVVSDISRDPLWAEFRMLALPLGFKACWSTPIRNPGGKVIATFAFYFRSHRGPTQHEREIVATCTHLCALAIEHDRMRERNTQLAYFDVLTGLPNRARFNQLLSELVGGQEAFGLILLDIDHLKSVNDSIGHAAGDRLISTVARRLAGANPKLIPCRLGGDEFAVLVPSCTDHETLGYWATLLGRTAKGMIQMEGQSFDAHVTMGGALFGLDGEDGDTLCQNADFALYHAKQNRRGGYTAFQAGLRTEMIHRIALVRQIDQALEEDRVLPHYQPIVNLETSEIVGLEALARVRMSDDRIGSAGEFHSALTDPRIAYEMTGKMLRQVARDMRSWLDAGIHFQHVGVNVTTGDFQRGDLAGRIVEIFGNAGVPLKHIVLEVNEAVYMGGDDDVVPLAVEALRNQGLLVALDDFGTGYASLTHLLNFPVDIIKIDRSFVSRLGIDQQSEILVGGMIDIVRKLGMRVVAEGVEDVGQADTLRRFGCRLGQGYLYSRPVPVRDCTRLLEAFGQSPDQVLAPARRSA